MKKRVLFSLAGLLAFAGSLLATDRYVSTTGSNSGGCTNAATPCATAAYGLSQMSAGDTLNFCAAECDGAGSGTFDERIDVQSKNGTSFSNAYTLQAFPGETITFRYSVPTVATWGLHFQSSSYIIVRNLIFDCYNIGGTCVHGTDGSPTFIRLEGNEIMNAGRYLGDFDHCTVPCNANGVLGDGPGWELLHNKIHDNGLGWLDHGIYGGDQSLLDGNEIYRNAGHGMQKFCSDTCPDGGGYNVVIRNNIFHDNGQSGWVSGSGATGDGWGLVLFNTPSGQCGATVYNNVFYHNFTGGLHMSSERCDKIFNNTFENEAKGTNAQGVPAAIWNESSVNLTVQNNIVHNSTRDISESGGSSGTTGNHNLCGAVAGSCDSSGDPSFKDSANGNFRLNSSSPAIDAGADLSATLTDDFDGTPRPKDGNLSGTAQFDIGAFEFVPAGSGGSTKVFKSSVIRAGRR